MKRFLIFVILAVVLMANAAQAARGKLYASGSLTFDRQSAYLLDMRTVVIVGSDEED